MYRQPLSLGSERAVEPSVPREGSMLEGAEERFPVRGFARGIPFIHFRQLCVLVTRNHNLGGLLVGAEGQVPMRGLARGKILYIFMENLCVLATMHHNPGGFRDHPSNPCGRQGQSATR